MTPSFKIVDLEQGSEAWHDFRKGKIGSSDAASIMGVSPWETPLQAFERMMFDTKKPVNAAMKRGSEMEKTARDWTNERSKTAYVPTVIQSLEFPDLIASLDGYFFDECHWLLEIKCPGERDHLEAIRGHIPDHYKPQLEHQLMVAGVDSMYYLSYNEDFEEKGVTILYHGDARYRQELFSQEMAFISRLADFKPPEPIDRDWVEIVDSAASQKVARLKTIRTIQKDLELESKTIETELKTDLTHPRTKIGGAKIQKIVRRGAVDYSKIEFLQTLDLEPYRKQNTEYWEIRV